ncbi:SusC/RagA family TonB-linked outer membrane protein [Fulvivirga sediminis]|uniref:TonB-dependent receptor n=1 Tax=Fulvivirga sediminis TaxID=2803949 RepID=A0A937K0I5_9BACT|nr:TonB-dependent receptor [Fulvivirga sediminis]MBL3655602.1 TonB-dependent receptor [Fulvivirga sediminis]
MKKILLMLLLFCFCEMAYAQHTVRGKVTAGGESVPGVSVVVQGTTKGTTTDIEGNYSLEVATGNETLVFSFIGYATQEVSLNGRTQININLEEDVTELQEVVVIGYGTQKKSLNTGANLQVKGEDIQRLSTTNALQGMQGQSAGVQISSTSGQPGAGLNVTIRGLGTVGNSSPLYVVDGVLTSDISYLNPADIESIDILKDAASAAIYGSQAANGVVLVTTKQGRAGSSRITFDAYYGVQQVPNKIDMLNAKEYATIMNEQAINSGNSPYFTPGEINSMGSGTDWMDEMFVDDAITENYALGLTGGSEKSVYSSSLSYTSQDGVVGGKDLSSYERYSFRFNSEHELFDGLLTFGENLTFSYTNDHGIGVGDQYNNALRSAFNTSPFVPMYDNDGNFWDNSGSEWYSGEANPYAQMVYENQNDNNDQKLLGNVYLEVEPIKNLKFRTSLGVDYYAYEDRSFSPEFQLSSFTFSRTASVTQSMGKGKSLLWDNLLSYDLNLNDMHDFKFMLGTSAYKFSGSNIYGTNKDLILKDLKYAWLTNATNKGGDAITLSGSPEVENRRLSYFGRVSYNYKETYIFNATFRADGSSNFASGHRWGYFPSLSAGWMVTNEDFLADADWLNSLKLRASWGRVGNQSIPPFQYLVPIVIEKTNYTFGEEEGVLTPGAYPKRLASQDIKWETSEQTDIGFDARLMSGKLSVNFDWYRKVTKDWLIPAPVLATAGAQAPFINGGDVVNKGIELALSYGDNVGDFNYNVSVNGAYNKNEVGNIPTSDGIIHGEKNQLFDNSLEFYRAQSGYPIGYFWGYETNGIFQNESEVSSYISNEGTLIQPTAQPGDLRIVDQNGDGVINELDKTKIGDPNPNYTFGINLSADYKGFDLSVLASGVAGNQIVQSYRNQANQFSNYTTAILDRWHGEGTSNDMPRVTQTSENFTRFTDLYIHDGDFLRISNITLGYNFTDLIKTDKVKKARLYFSVLNLHTFTRYSGMDPEVGYGIDGSGDQIGAFSSGIDLGYYPRPRTYMVGVNLEF